MNVTVAQYKKHDLVFTIDEEDSVWFIIKNSQSGAHVDAAAFGSGDHAINKNFNGDVEQFIDHVLERSNSTILKFFGEDSLIPTTWQERFRQFFQNEIAFNTNPSRLVRK